MNLIVKYDPPPIPIRTLDWSAVDDNYEPGEPIGYGPTRQAAISDCLEQAECREATDVVGLDGSCGLCGAAQGEECRAMQAVMASP